MNFLIGWINVLDNGSEIKMIKKARKFGKYSRHITMPKGKDGEQFIVLPIRYKFILKELLKRVEKELLKPLSSVLNMNDISYVRECIEEEIKKKRKSMGGNVIKVPLKSYYLNLGGLSGPSDLRNVIAVLMMQKRPRKGIIDKIRKVISHVRKV